MTSYGRFLIAFVSPLMFLSLAGFLRGENIRLASGFAPVLSSIVCGDEDFEPAFPVSVPSDWGFLPGTRWLQPDGTGQHTTCSVYEATFVLPEGYLDPKLMIDLFVDDQAVVYLNSSKLGQVGGFYNPPKRLSTQNPRSFRSGENVLRLEASSGSGVHGIDFLVVVDYMPGDTLEDSDQDGIPDWWERQSGLNVQDDSDAMLDADRDGLTNLREFELRSNPRISDSDGDGLDDSVEAELRTDLNSQDTDGDGSSDLEEITLGYDPRNSESFPRKEMIRIRSGFEPILARSCGQGSLLRLAQYGNKLCPTVRR